MKLVSSKVTLILLGLLLYTGVGAYAITSYVTYYGNVVANSIQVSGGNGGGGNGLMVGTAGSDTTGIVNFGVSTGGAGSVAQLLSAATDVTDGIYAQCLGEYKSGEIFSVDCNGNLGIQGSLHSGAGLYPSGTLQSISIQSGQTVNGQTCTSFLFNNGGGNLGCFDISGDLAVANNFIANNVTATSLNSGVGDCVQAGTNGLLTVVGNPCAPGYRADTGANFPTFHSTYYSCTVSSSSPCTVTIAGSNAPFAYRGTGTNYDICYPASNLTADTAGVVFTTITVSTTAGSHTSYGYCMGP